jgi:hypothetical protein
MDTRSMENLFMRLIRTFLLCYTVGLFNFALTIDERLLSRIRNYAIVFDVERLGAPLTQALGALKGKI